MRRLLLSLLLLTLTLAARPASAEVVQRTGRFGGLAVTYVVSLPPGYDAAKAYPVVLVFTGGPQLLRMAEGTVKTDWEAEANRRGYVVVSPGTPDGSLFFERADRIFPEFLDMLVREFKPAGGRLHIAGHSNGGLSAFHVAGKFPQYVATVTGYPGLFDGPGGLAAAPALKSACLFMHVGELDEGWRGAMRQQADALMRQGYRIQFTVEPKQVHRIKAGEVNLSPRLFDAIEGCRPAAKP